MRIRNKSMCRIVQKPNTRTDKKIKTSKFSNEYFQNLPNENENNQYMYICVEKLCNNNKKNPKYNLPEIMYLIFQE